MSVPVSRNWKICTGASSTQNNFFDLYGRKLHLKFLNCVTETIKYLTPLCFSKIQTLYSGHSSTDWCFTDNETYGGYNQGPSGKPCPLGSIWNGTPASEKSDLNKSVYIPGVYLKCDGGTGDYMNNSCCPGQWDPKDKEGTHSLKGGGETMCTGGGPDR